VSIQNCEIAIVFHAQTWIVINSGENCTGSAVGMFAGTYTATGSTVFFQYMLAPGSGTPNGTNPNLPAPQFIPYMIDSSSGEDVLTLTWKPNSDPYQAVIATCYRASNGGGGNPQLLITSPGVWNSAGSNTRLRAVFLPNGVFAVYYVPIPGSGGTATGQIGVLTEPIKASDTIQLTFAYGSPGS
jgi:hypothetical protein